MQKFKYEEKATGPSNGRNRAGVHQFATGKQKRVVAWLAYMLPRKNTLFMEHALRKPVESRRAYKQRRNTIALGMILTLLLAAAMTILLIG